jgi:hypothetical protein
MSYAIGSIKAGTRSLKKRKEEIDVILDMM